MACKICGRASCASYMHSIEEQAEFDSVSELDEAQLRWEVIDLRREVASLKDELAATKEEGKTT